MLTITSIQIDGGSGSGVNGLHLPLSTGRLMKQHTNILVILLRHRVFFWKVSDATGRGQHLNQSEYSS